MLADADGLYSVAGTVQRQENAMTDGSTYLGTVQQARNITLTLYDRLNDVHDDARTSVFNAFPLKTQGVLTYQENGAPKRIGYYVESVQPESMGKARLITVSLLCPDPFFEDVSESEAVTSQSAGAFSFAHEFLEAGESLGEITDLGGITVFNWSGADSIGVRLVLQAKGSVTNPWVKHSPTGSVMQFSGVSMAKGDQLTVTTHPGNMTCKLKKAAGSTQNVLSKLTFASEFLRLSSGKNGFSKGAGSGAGNLTLRVFYRNKYPGA